MTNEIQQAPLPPAHSPHNYIVPPPRREPQKSYVFIDEQNRHKRLKVVKACLTCRKRKIKCDGAQTNEFPCGACTRLHVTCVPPPVHPELENTFAQDDGSYEEYAYHEPMASYPAHHPSGDLYYYQQGPPVYPAHEYGRLNTYNYGPLQQQYPYSAAAPPDPFSMEYRQPPQQPTDHVANDSTVKPRQDSTATTGSSEISESELANQMGDLKISGVGHAPYLINNRALAEQPAVQEEEVELPKATGPGAHVKIPEEMMPPDGRARRYFHYFFENVHPYVPVLHPSTLLSHWSEAKDSISPLILESIFAIATRMLGEQDESARWLALAKKHEESFKDTPRLSTLQGLLLLLKARETMPTRGYYYRSWMSVVTMIAMAKDMRLHEHNEDHQDGGGCAHSWHDCFIKSRVWHTLYVVELMVGGPQGRIDFGATTDTVDFKFKFPHMDLRNPEYRISEQFSFYLASIRMVRDSIRIYASLRKKKKDWAIDPGYLDHNSRYDRWLGELPPHLRVQYPDDGSAPSVPLHFVANLHSYFNLCIIMHHRPQLQAFEDLADESWRKVMVTCYAAAKRLCRLQEAIMMEWGMPGFLCMQRGVNFTIYSVLTCTMLHLIAVTHPHPEISHQAAEYFTRHMRILEQCSSSWPMAEMEKQIFSLRQAFSADINKPFELKSNFPGSPQQSDKSSSPHATSTIVQTPPTEHPTPDPQQPYFQHEPSPSAQYMGGDDYPTPDSDSLALMNMEQSQYQPEAQTNFYAPHNYQWNPAPIMRNFEAMMAPPPDTSPQSSTSPTSPNVAQQSNYFPPQQPQPLNPQYSTYTPAPPANAPYLNSVDQMISLPTVATTMPQPQPIHRVAPPPPQPQYVTPDMWQNALATAYGAGSKRRWDGNGYSYAPENVKRPR